MKTSEAAWKTLRRDSILDAGKFLRVERHVVELPDGRVIDDWAWVVCPDYVNVIAVTPEGRFLLFRQVKYSVQGRCLAPVGGYLEPGERPLAAARRELHEEAGCVAARWTNLGGYRVDSNRGVCMAHAFLAEGVRRVAEPHADDLETMTPVLVDAAGMRRAVARGAFPILPWASAAALALLHLDGRSGGEEGGPRVSRVSSSRSSTTKIGTTIKTKMRMGTRRGVVAKAKEGMR